MEGITNIVKTKEEIARCQIIVKDEIDLDMSEDMVIELTKDIMDTALFIGGDFSDENIKEIAKQYQKTGAIDRFIRKNDK
jgi:hypothetical protein